jgi:hypothetical protein
LTFDKLLTLYPKRQNSLLFGLFVKNVCDKYLELKINVSFFLLNLERNASGIYKMLHQAYEEGTLNRIQVFV